MEGGPQYIACTLNSLPRIGGLDRAVYVSRILRGKEQIKSAELCLPRFLLLPASHELLTGVPSCSLSLSDPSPCLTSMILPQPTG